MWQIGLVICGAMIATGLDAHSADLDETCDGSWVLPNIPANIGRVRARATCVRAGVTTRGQSAFFLVLANGVLNNVPPIVFDAPAPIPARLTLTAPAATLAGLGATVQLTTTATYSDSHTADLSSAASGTNYTSSNPAIASVSADGLLTAHASGAVLVTALNDRATGLLRLMVLLSADSDGDGIPDDYEIACGMNPNDATDALEDPDHGGLTNLHEYQLGPALAIPTPTTIRCPTVSK